MRLVQMGICRWQRWQGSRSASMFPVHFHLYILYRHYQLSCKKRKGAAESGIGSSHLISFGGGASQSGGLDVAVEGWLTVSTLESLVGIVKYTNKVI